VTAYFYTDPYGYRMEIRTSEYSERGAVKILAADDIDIPAMDLSVIVAKLYEAAGQKPPIILPRRSVGPVFARRDGYIDPDLDYVPDPDETIDPARAFEIAAWFASAAREAVETGPDPAAVEALTELIDEHSDDDAGELARALLAAGYTKADA
jgi:hypothetical protein